MSNIDIDNDNIGEIMEDSRSNAVGGIDWRQTAQWVLAALLTLFLFAVNSQASDLKLSIQELRSDFSEGTDALNKDVQQIKMDMAARLTRLETLQALQAAQCK